jgi:hypothetical protein
MTANIVPPAPPHPPGESVAWLGSQGGADGTGGDASRDGWVVVDGKVAVAAVGLTLVSVVEASTTSIGTEALKFRTSVPQPLMPTST